ncbi:MAG: putative fatty-acid--CoA ligase [Frankiales bacterium]|nr:putative fatty-acid--CoA ligase [Frankiales bacterium]
MYTTSTARSTPDKPAIIFEPGGSVVTYGELDRRANQLAHVFRSTGLQTGDHVAIYLDNHPTFLEFCSAAERSGLYYTCVSAQAKVDELAYVVDNCDARLLVTSEARADVVRSAVEAGRIPHVERILLVDATASPAAPFESYAEAIASAPTTPIADEQSGTWMLYSSGTTGRPKGILRPLPAIRPDEPQPFLDLINSQIFQMGPDRVYLCASPTYHVAPLSQCSVALRAGATIVLMQRFDPILYLDCIERYRVTNAGPVPTMFVRLLKLPDEIRKRYDVSSLKRVVHQSAPCPVEVKRAMIEWWGPVLLDLYGASESQGLALITSEEWLEHPGSVGRTVYGVPHVLRDDGSECGVGEPGLIYFEGTPAFEYYKDPGHMADILDPSGTMTTAGDFGYLDADGYLYLTERRANVILRGGVNIYPREIEDVLIGHPKVFDVGVCGVPHEEYGEDLLALVQLMPDALPTEEVSAELVAYCNERLARQKCPKVIEFVSELPRLASGKLSRKLLRDAHRDNGQRDPLSSNRWAPLPNGPTSDAALTQVE